MSITQRFLQSPLLLCLLVFNLVMIVVIVLSSTVASKTPEQCFSTEDRDYAREIALGAIDHALANHVTSLFSIWLKDFHPEPTRAMAGMDNGLSAYARARANAKTWDPPLCPE